MSDITRVLNDPRAVRAGHRERFVAWLGTLGLSGLTLDQLFACACREIGELMAAEFVEILRCEPDRRTLRVVAGVGWREGVVGHATVSSDITSQAGYTLARDAPVHVADFATEPRVAASSLLTDHGVRSGISVPIHARERVFGVLAVHATRPEAFAPEDGDFLVAVANVLGAAVGSADLREAERRAIRMMRVLFDESPDVIVLVDDGGNVLAVNPAGARTLGYETADIVGRDVFEFVHADDLPKARDAWQAVLTGSEQVVHVDVRVHTRAGSLRIMDVVGRAIRSSEVRQVVINARDVTDKRALEESLARMQGMKAVGAIAASVAHDINNLLQVIAGSAGIIEDETPDSSLRDEARQILATADLAGRLLHGALLSARTPQREPEPVELNAVVANVLPVLHRIVHRRARLEFVPTTLRTTITAHVTDLEQILINLVVNARDASPDDGLISIATWTSGLSESRRVVLSVADRGAGISESVRNRLFEPLFTTKADGRGNGLGLVIVETLVRRNRGSITVSSEPGHGTTFELCFPEAGRS
jgi:PAS domain S-box-containing protein